MNRPAGLTQARAVVLEALMDLPLGASVREIARHLGRDHMTVEHHVHRLKRTGHVEIVKRGYHKRRVVVPVRMRLSDTEREWLKLGPTTARAIVIVARANGKRVTGRTVAKTLQWTETAAQYHLQRARAAGILDGRRGAGYALACACELEQEHAGLPPRTLTVVQWIVQQARRVKCADVARALELTPACARYHLRRAARAGLLTERPYHGYAPSHGANLVNWQKSTTARA